MSNILNLDQISTKEDKTIILDGVKHAFAPISVGAFIDQIKRLEEMEQNGKRKLSENMEHSLEMIAASFPTLTLKHLRSLTKDQIDAIGKFIRGEMLTEAVEGAASVTGESPEELKKE